MGSRELETPHSIPSAHRVGLTPPDPTSDPALGGGAVVVPQDDTRSAPRRPRPDGIRPGGWLNVSLAGVVLAGILLMLYPSAASWFFALREAALVDAHVEEVQRISQDTRDRIRESAIDYNATLTHGLIVDPFGTASEQAELDDDARRYLAELNPSENGVMASLTVPKIGAKLTISHGATEEILRSGVGHIYGSSLPTGGAGTHSVLTAHSGIPEAELFTDLNRLGRGDEFTISVLGETLHYRVTGQETVLPTDISKLGVTQGKDLVTLITCTPIGINTHRLLVHAERVPAPAEQGSGAQESGVSIPWWILGVLAGIGLLAATLTRALRRPKPAAATPRGRRRRNTRRTRRSH